MSPWIAVALVAAALVAGYGLGNADRTTDARALAGLLYDAGDDFDLAHAFGHQDEAVHAARTLHLVHAITGVHLEHVPGSEPAPTP